MTNKHTGRGFVFFVTYRVFLIPTVLHIDFSLFVISSFSLSLICFFLFDYCTKNQTVCIMSKSCYTYKTTHTSAILTSYHVVDAEYITTSIINRLNLSLVDC